MKKSFLPILLLLLLSLTLLFFVGCKDDATDTSTTTSENNDQALTEGGKNNDDESNYWHKYKLTLTTNIEGAGTVSSSSIGSPSEHVVGYVGYRYNTDVNIKATANEGYEFLGWYYGTDLLSTSAQYNFLMWKQDVTLEAKFLSKKPPEQNPNPGNTENSQPGGVEQKMYKLHIKSAMPKCGKISVFGSSSQNDYTLLSLANTTVKVISLTTSSNRFLGWFDSNGNLVTVNGSFDFTMPASDYTLTAKWDCFHNYVYEEGQYLCENCGNIDEKFTINNGLVVLKSTNELVKYVGTASSVIIPNTITSIGKKAFDGCSGLTSITIPSSVTSIGDYAFRNCSGLTAVYITDLAAWCNISFGSYNANPLRYAENLYLNGNKVTSLEIPSGVTSIGNYAFEGCSGLTSIMIPESVTSIGSSAFGNCNSLTSVTIPEGVTSIGDGAFKGCSGLTSIKYRGTKVQWNAISKGYDWNYNTGDYTITYNYTGE